MKGVVRFVLAVVLSLVVALPGTLTAQDDGWACDDGPNDILNAARAAYHDNDDPEAAYELGVQAQIVCRYDHERSSQARSFVNLMEARLHKLNVENMQPGMVDLGDFKLFMHCAGEGSPTVIFEYGWGGSAADWEDILPPISTVTRACRYSRRRGDHDTWLTTQDHIDDLALLLQTTTIDPPYVLVAHSYGGWITLLFTDQHPDWVQGVVLVDASHPDFLEVMSPGFCDELAVEEVDTNAVTEWIDLCASSTQVADLRSFGDRPLVVLTEGLLTGELAALWNPLQEDYLTFSTNSRHIIAEHSTHNIMGSEPELVIEAILWVLDEIGAADTE